LRRRQDAELNFEIVCFGEGYGMEARVFECGGASGVGDGAVNRAYGEDVAYASA
jgi:hypothetical protein